MPFSTTYANNILNYLFAKTKTLTAPEFVYIGLSSNDPEADNGTFTELSGNGYSRVLICNRDQTYPNHMSSASNRSITNSTQINWTKATGDWANVKGFGLFNAPTGGTPFYYGKITSGSGTVSVSTGAVALYEAGKLQITLSTTDEAIAST